MAGVEHAPTDNATLLHRIVQLEHERDELRRNMEQLSTSRSGSFGSVDIAARIQRQRAMSLEQELEACQRKVTACSKENTKLQEELSEVYIIKSKFAELLKVEVEKSAGLEKEVKFYQSRVAVAISDRDRLIFEVENCKRKEDGLMETMMELQDRLEQINSEYTQQKNLSSELQKDLEKTKAEREEYQKVVERFWKVREQGTGFCDAEKIQDRATILLHDSEDFWSYGEMNQNLQAQVKQAKADLAMVQDEFQVCSASVASLRSRFEEESVGRRQAEAAVFRYKEQLYCLIELVDSELQQIRSTKVSLKEDILSFLQEEENWLLSISESWQHALGKDVTSSVVAEPIIIDDDRVDMTSGSDQKEAGGTTEQLTDAKSFCTEALIQNTNRPLEEDNRRHLLDNCSDGLAQASHETMNGENRTFEVDDHQLLVVDNNQEASTQDAEKKDKQAAMRTLDMDSQMLLADDSKEAFAQALQEKVAALLLLSQQEERHILEENTTSALESQIADLKQQLLQVTSEKVHALMELARLHQECRKLRKQEKNFKQTLHNRGFSSNGLSPVGSDGNMSEDENVVRLASDTVRKASLQGYLKHLWLRGPELNFRSKSLSHLLSLSTSKENDTAGIARLRVENASLRENISSIRHLCNSANRLRLTIGRVAAESGAQTEDFIQAAVEAVDGVISEALHLKVALHNPVPENDLGWNSIGSPLARANETAQDGSDGEANDDLDVVSFLGQEIVRLVLLAAQLQKRLLNLNIGKQ